MHYWNQCACHCWSSIRQFLQYIYDSHAVPAPLTVNYVIENATLRINWTVSDEMLNSIIFIILYIKLLTL